MKINLSPIRSDLPAPILKLVGDVLIIDGESFDFGPMVNGDRLPFGAVKSVMFVGDVTKTNGEVELTLLLPHGANPPSNMAFPQPITMKGDGPVPLPVMPEPEDGE